MGNTELFLYLNGDWREVELGENIVVPITYNIADVRDIAARNASFTKTFSLPDTNVNRNLFYQIYDVANVSTFDLTKKVKAYVLRDTVEILYGNFQITGIKTVNDKDFIYECVIYSDTDTMFQNIGERTLGDLDFGRFDHRYNFFNITDTWTGTAGQIYYTNGYYYPLIDYNNNWDYTSINQVWVPGQQGFGGLTSFNGVGDTFLKPALYTKVVFDEIIKEAGYIYESDFLNRAPFTELIHPFSTNNIRKSRAYYYDTRIRIGMSASQPVTRSTPVVNSFGISEFMADVFGYTNSTLNKIRFDDETPPNGDYGNHYDNLNYEYIGGQNPINQRFCVNLDFTIDKSFLQSFSSSTTLGKGGDVFIRIQRSASVFSVGTASVPGGASVPIQNASKHYIGIGVGGPNGTTVADNLNAPFLSIGGFNRAFYFLTNPSGLYPYPYFATGQYAQNLPQNITTACGPGNLIQDTATFSRFRVQVQTPWLDGTTADRTPIRQGESVWVEIGMLLNNNTIQNLVIPASSTGPYPLIINNDNSYFFSEPFPDFLPGDFIDVGSGLPEKTKQKDYLTSIIKMFNLYIEPISDNRIRIEPRDLYYKSGAQKDWSGKLDLTKEIGQKLIADLQSKELKFSYKGDKDYLNTLYFDKYDEVYGERIYDTENEFIKGRKNIDLIFSPTPERYIPNSPGGAEAFVIPYIDSIDSNSKKNTFVGQNLRILTKGIGWTPLPPGIQWTFNSVVYNHYPYSGMLNDAQNPTYTLEFLQSKERYFSQQFNTQNDLFNSYWRSQITELYDKDSRIITAYFWLTPQDLYDFRFNDRIFVDKISSGTNNWFRVNKIDYDGTGFTPAKVELIKVFDLDLTIVKSGEQKTLPPLVPDIPAPVDKNTGGFGGDWNYSGSNGGLVVGGYYNNIGRDVKGVVVGGNGNEIEIGGNNISLVNTYNSFVGGSASQVSILNSEGVYLFNGGNNISISNVKGLTMTYPIDGVSINNSKNVILINDKFDGTIPNRDLDFTGLIDANLNFSKLDNDIDYDGNSPVVYQNKSNIFIDPFTNGIISKPPIKHHFSYYSGVNLETNQSPLTSNVSWYEGGSVAHPTTFDPDVANPLTITYSLQFIFNPDWNRYIYVNTGLITGTWPADTIVREIMLPQIDPDPNGLWQGCKGREYIIKFNDLDPNTGTSSGKPNAKLRIWGSTASPGATIDGMPFIELDSKCSPTVRLWAWEPASVFGQDMWLIDYEYDGCVGPTGSTASTEIGRHAIINDYGALAPLRFGAGITSENLVCQAYSSPNQSVLYPFIPDRDMIVTRMIVFVCIAGGVSQQFWLSIYDSDSPNPGEGDLPFTQLFLSPNLPTNPAGVVQAVVPNLQLNRGQKYWLMIKNNSFGGASFHHLTTSSMLPLGQQLGGIQQWNHIAWTFAGAPPANTGGPVGNLASGNVPNITLEVV